MSELIENLNSFQHRSPKLYLGFAALFAISGICMLLMFPFLSLYFLISTLTTLFSLEQFTDIAPLVYQLPLSALCAYLSYQFITLPLDTPKTSEIYISLNKKKSPKLISLIEELQQHFDVKDIDTILLTDQYDISTHITPEHCLPNKGFVTLQIGLPIMQTVSAKQFKALLARRIGQLSLNENKVTGRIKLFHDTFNQYLNACKHNSHWSYIPFYYLIRGYQSIFSAVAFYAFRMDELSADQYALEIIDGKSFSQTLSQTIIANHYLKNIFWMSMYKLQRQYPNKSIFPHANMAVSFSQGIDKEKSKQLLEQNFTKISDFDSTTPLLRDRLLKLGLEEISLPIPLNTTAAIVYLDTALPKVTTIFDKLWLQRTNSSRESNSQLDSNAQRLHTLTEKVKQQALSAEETWELAVLTEKVNGYHAAIPVYKKILERNPMHAKSMFAIGRILLSYNDETGIDALNKATFLDPAMKKTADELIARYNSRINETVEQKDELFA